jgi:hypothetical protein
MENSKTIYAGVINSLFDAGLVDEDIVLTLRDVGIDAEIVNGTVEAKVDETQQLTMEKIFAVATLLAASKVHNISSNPAHRSPQYWAMQMFNIAGVIWLANPAVRQEFLDDKANAAIDAAGSFEDFSPEEGDDDFGDADGDDHDSLRDVIAQTILQPAEGVAFNWDHIICVQSDNEGFMVNTALMPYKYSFSADYVVDANHLMQLMYDAKIATARLLGG